MVEIGDACDRNEERQHTGRGGEKVYPQWREIGGWLNGVESGENVFAIVRIGIAIVHRGAVADEGGLLCAVGGAEDVRRTHGETAEEEVEET